MTEATMNVITNVAEGELSADCARAVDAAADAAGTTPADFVECMAAESSPLFVRSAYNSITDPGAAGVTCGGPVALGVGQEAGFALSDTVVIQAPGAMLDESGNTYCNGSLEELITHERAHIRGAPDEREPKDVWHRSGGEMRTGHAVAAEASEAVHFDVDTRRRSALSTSDMTAMQALTREQERSGTLTYLVSRSSNPRLRPACRPARRLRIRWESKRKGNECSCDSVAKATDKGGTRREGRMARVTQVSSRCRPPLGLAAGATVVNAVLAFALDYLGSRPSERSALLPVLGSGFVIALSAAAWALSIRHPAFWRDCVAAPNSIVSVWLPVPRSPLHIHRCSPASRCSEFLCHNSSIAAGGRWAGCPPSLLGFQ